MSMKNHYDVLGVPRQATHEEIKAAFRKLSFEHHPDVAKESNGEIFKAIANAHSVLSNPNERRRYDRQLEERTMWRQPGYRPPGEGGDWYGRDHHFRRPTTGTNKRGMHVAMDTLTHPRYVIMGIAGFGTIFMLASFLGGISSKQPQYHHHSSTLVEAWKNPSTGRWEQPAPWDPVYRQLKPKLELVPREKVIRRNV
jgi:curved DNA-binding protein CbpA